MSNAVKNFDILATNLRVLHNYFGLIKLFLLLSVSKFLDTLAKPFSQHINDSDTQERFFADVMQDENKHQQANRALFTL